MRGPTMQGITLHLRDIINLSMGMEEYKKLWTLSRSYLIVVS